jgi:hypothetical protein
VEILHMARAGDPYEEIKTRFCQKKEL